MRCTMLVLAYLSWCISEKNECAAFGMRNFGFAPWWIYKKASIFEIPIVNITSIHLLWRGILCLNNPELNAIYSIRSPNTVHRYSTWGEPPPSDSMVSILCGSCVVRGRVRSRRFHHIYYSDSDEFIFGEILTPTQSTLAFYRMPCWLRRTASTVPERNRLIFLRQNLL